MKKYVTTEELYELFIKCGQKTAIDTRKLEKGSIFFALRGDNFDANSFAQTAIDGGCEYAIVDAESVSNAINILLVNNVLESLQQLSKYHRERLKCQVIGITGSNGKTTNKELIHAVLSKKYRTYATKGNLNNHIGVPLTLLALTDQHEMAIVEMGANHQGEIALLSDLCDPDFGLITNIGRAHLEGFGGLEGVKKGKSELYAHLRKKNAKIFINGDDEVLQDLSKNLEKISYGENIEFDVHGQLCDASEYVEFKWNVRHQQLDSQPVVKTYMFGQYNFINTLCAACVGNYFGVKESDINSALASYLPEMNRSQVKKTELNTLILDAYNANPSSMSLAIDNFAKQRLTNKIVILGDMLEMGEYSDFEHESILDQLSRHSIEKIFLVGAHFFKLEEKFPAYAFFRNVEELNTYFSKNKIAESTILIKGSRGIQLEKTVIFL
ncbi:MAG: UDP-N-acetylmuramoyl-tripeptide--D-alanyl-D-alanine ligase [Bacteroidota bacterium]